jgi:uncharacterized repeat protein (TIGR03837 family)
VVDNYGDIGTTWRLAKQLHHQYQQKVTLIVDVLAALKHLVPEASSTASEQKIYGITVLHWTDALNLVPADVIIEAFACELPLDYRQAMHQHQSVWLNLEYFSCEDWVTGCHRLPSLQYDGLKKWFYFPGFIANTGGLLREANLINQRNNFLTNATIQLDWLHKYKIPEPQPDADLRISLFAYENVAVGDLLSQLIQLNLSVDIYVLEGKLLSSLQPYLDNNCSSIGQTYQHQQLRIHVIPFLPQAEFDQLLWLCDLNFVRGEESLTRAIWAGKPFVWHIYPTEDEAHWDKLHAFISAYQLPEALVQLTKSWNQQQLKPNTIATYWLQHQSVSQICHQKSAILSEQADLVDRLVHFVQNQL